MAMLNRVRAAVDRAHWWQAVLSGQLIPHCSNRSVTESDEAGAGEATPNPANTIPDAGDNGARSPRHDDSDSRH